MLRFGYRVHAGQRYYKNAGSCPPLRLTRKRARLSRFQMAVVLGCSVESIRHWETKRENWTAARIAYLLYVAYLRHDPVHGWENCVLCLTPDGEIAPELAQIAQLKDDGMTQVAGYQRRSRHHQLTASKAVFPQKPKRVKVSKSGQVGPTEPDYQI
jgi:hypothetical protein